MRTKEEIELLLQQNWEIVFEQVYKPENEILDSLSKMTTDLESCFANSPENIQNVLGGEFKQTTQVVDILPLFLKLELMEKAIEANFKEKFNNIEKMQNILDKMKSLREKAATLEYNKIFNPNEELNQYIVSDLIGAKGRFELKAAKKEEVKHLAIQTINKHERIINANGDYYNDGPQELSYSGFNPMYKSDYEKINSIQFEQTQINRQKLSEMLEKYSLEEKNLHDVVGTIENLKSKNVDPRIIGIIENIAHTKKQHPHEELGNFVLEELYEIEQIENKISSKTQEKEARDKAIKAAKERYNSKNFLWKFVNKKQSPEKVNFDQMSIEEIEKIYNKKGR